MDFILALVKTYIIILLFRFASTQQELLFNQVARVFAMLSDPIFRLFKLKKSHEKWFIVFLIFTLIIISAFVGVLLNVSYTPVQSFIMILSRFVIFFMIFYMVAVLVGAILTRANGGIFGAYFYRFAVPWVNLTRVFVKISSAKIVFVVIPVVFLFFMSLNFLLMLIGAALSDNIILEPIAILRYSSKMCVIGFGSIFYYISWVLVARALISWVSPDVRNPIVQLIYSVTEPILAPLRRIIPAIGIFDLSAMVAIVGFWFLSSLIERLAIYL